MTISEIYHSFGMNDKKKEDEDRCELLKQTHWFTANTIFDPKTGDALPQALSVFLAKVAQPDNFESVHDRLWRITDHARTAIERLFRALNESPHREQAMMPISAVRELDANSFIKLSNRPGRNIREKLAGKPYLQAVHRFQSIDLPENRLLKVFVTRLSELLVLRQEHLGEEEDELLPRIQNWLLTDEAKSIASWDNLQPNNTLLSHREYRRIWDAWRWLQSLDDDIIEDFSHLEDRARTMAHWIKYGKIYSDGHYLFADMPVFFDYEKFKIRSWHSPLVKKLAQKIIRFSSIEKISTPVCVDLTLTHPCYAAFNLQNFNEPYIWQQWKNSNDSVDIELFTSDAVYLHPDTLTISSSDLFFSRNNAPEYLDRAAQVFTRKLRESFENNKLIWLVPDLLNDWEIEITRRNINVRFQQAEPLPRSVAAVFEQVNYSQIKNDGFSVLVLDYIGSKTCATKLIARFNEGLKERLPETNGIYWERCPPVILSEGDSEDTEIKRLEIDAVDSEGKWHNAKSPETFKYIEQDMLKNNNRIEQFDSFINILKSPVTGGIHLYNLQQQAGDIPLWRDHIPELSIKVWEDGRYHRFCLVGNNTTIRPQRGKAIPITISDLFTLPAKKQYYQLPLFQGENDKELGFSARLDSSAFPLDKDTVCKLNLTFEYGADEPYKLVFVPLDKSFPPIQATWRRKEEVTDASAPEYPKPLSWDELQNMPKPDSNKTRDFLEWILKTPELLDNILIIQQRKRTVGIICRTWQLDRKKNNYTFAICKEKNLSVLINERYFIEGLQYENFKPGDEISFELKESDGKYSGKDIANIDYEEKIKSESLSSIINSIHKSLYVPFIYIWSDGRSITDKECPEPFKDAIKKTIDFINGLLTQSEIIQDIKNEILFLMSCLHKDTTDQCRQWLFEQVENNSISDPRSLGFSLGDLSEKWQRDLFNKLVSNPNASSISVLAYSIWREEQFFEKFSISELHLILNELNTVLSKITVCPTKNIASDKKIIRKWIRSTAEPLELLLGLLRTRTSSDPEIKVILQPNQKITKILETQLERVALIVAEAPEPLFSRVQMKIQKSGGDLTLDLLYALRLYLTGDDGANAIQITGVSDNDNE
jgi:hypothetical protein